MALYGGFYQHDIQRNRPFFDALLVQLVLGISIPKQTAVGTGTPTFQHVQSNLKELEPLTVYWNWTKTVWRHR